MSSTAAEVSRKTATHGVRLCTRCGAGSPIGSGEAIWPLDFRCAACGFEAPVVSGIAVTAPELADTVSGFDPADFEFLSQAERTHFWFTVRRRLILSLAKKYAPQARSFVEVGCGSGNVSKALSEWRDWDRFLATEIHPTGLTLAHPTMPAQVELLQADGRTLPFERTFDLAGAFDVLEHIREDEAVMARIHRGLVPGGIFLATVPQHPFLWSAADEVAYHERRYRRGELERKLVDAGFEILFSTSYMALLFPVMAANRLLARKTKDVADSRVTARKEFAISPWLNRVMQTVLSAEISMTERGFRWPAGGSRVVVARAL
jgi:SAM-dependent methyltransferase